VPIDDLINHKNLFIQESANIFFEIVANDDLKKEYINMDFTRIYEIKVIHIKCNDYLFADLIFVLIQNDFLLRQA